MSFRRRTRTAVVVLALSLAAAGCGGGSTPSEVPSTSAPAETVTLDITIAGGQVSPNGQKIDARVGQRVVANVTSDVDDEIHAHTGGDGYELEVTAGKPTTGGFDLTTPGSFEVESHGTGKIIAILNVR